MNKTVTLVYARFMDSESVTTEDLQASDILLRIPLEECQSGEEGVGGHPLRGKGEGGGEVRGGETGKGENI